MPKKSFINQVHYYEKERLLCLVMIDREIKFFRVSRNEKAGQHQYSRETPVRYEYIPEMKYVSKFVVRNIWVERHKVTRLLIACLAGESHFQVIIVDPHCPDAEVGGGAFGDNLFSQSFKRSYGSITQIMY